MFQTVTGNKQLKQTLKGLIETKRLPHCFILQGQPHFDKIGFALEIAAALNCEQNGCGVCKDCKNILNNNHQDIKVVQKLEDKTEFTIDIVRQMKADSFVAPGSAKYKVYILKDSHLLNVQAQNALLKILEEPLDDTVFILTCVSDTLLLETIRSRAVTFTIAEDTTNGANETVGEALAPQEQQYLEILTEKSGFLQQMLLKEERALLQLAERLILSGIVKRRDLILQQVAILYNLKDKEIIKQIVLLTQQLCKMGIEYKTLNQHAEYLPGNLKKYFDKTSAEMLLNLFDRFGQIIENLPIHLNTSVAQVYFASQISQ